MTQICAAERPDAKYARAFQTNNAGGIFDVEKFSDIFI